MRIDQDLQLNSKDLLKVRDSIEASDEKGAIRQLRDYYKTRKKDAFFMDKEQVFAYIKNSPDSDYMEIADALCENTFLFNQPWDMEKCTEKITLQSPVNWSYVHNHDREWMWMLNRHHYWICLMQAYVKTGEERYLNTCFGQLEQWLDSETDPAGKAYTTWRTIDVGIRLKNWIKILEYVIDSDRFTDHLFIKMMSSIYHQIEYLMNSYRREYSLTNWRILEFHGALIASIYFPEFKKSQEWIERCIKIFNDCITLQVANDGFHWEQSYMYHVEMLLCMRDVILICKRNHIKLPESLTEITIKMADAVAHMITPMGTQPCYGDSDIEDLRELLAGLGLLFGNKEYLFHGRGCKSVNLVCNYGTLVPDAPPGHGWEKPILLDYAHEDVGNYFLRSGWDDNAGYLFFKNGFLGSGHGHCDLLHLEIFSKGNPVLVDSGRYTYREDTKDRQRFKSSAAHNTLLVDGEEFIIQEGSWDNKKTATAIKRPAVINKEICYLQGAHMGYMDKGVLVNRKIIYIKPDIWLIVDEGFANEAHTYRQYFHFAKDSLDVRGNEIIYTDEKQVFRITQMQNSKAWIEDIELSPAYNETYRSKGAVVETEGMGDTYMTAVCVSEAFGKKSTVSKGKVCDMDQNEVDSQSVTCVKIAIGQEEWIVFTNHKEENKRRQVYIIEDNLIFARTAVLHKKEGEVKTHILEY